MKFKRFLEAVKDKPNKQNKPGSEEIELTPEEILLQKIVLLRIELKDAETDAKAESIQAQIDKLLLQQKEEKEVKLTKDSDTKKSKTKEKFKEMEYWYICYRFLVLKYIQLFSTLGTSVYFRHL